MDLFWMEKQTIVPFDHSSFVSTLLWRKSWHNCMKCFGFHWTGQTANMRHFFTWVLHGALVLILHQILTKASLRGPQGTEPAGAVQSTKAQDFPLQLAMGIQKDQHHATWFHLEMLKQPQRNIFSVREKGKTMQPLICTFSMNTISNWRINIWTITEVPNTLPWAYEDSKHNDILLAASKARVGELLYSLQWTFLSWL